MRVSGARKGEAGVRTYMRQLFATRGHLAFLGLVFPQTWMYILSSGVVCSEQPDVYKRQLLGRMPSAVGYQPTLATEMGDLQERITSTKTGSITSVQACLLYTSRCV